jgi:hypothetical protein
VFNVKGNDYRLVVAVNYRHRIVGVLLVLGLLSDLPAWLLVVCSPASGSRNGARQGLGNCSCQR